MDLMLILSILGLAFVCEYIDSSLGMGYGTLLTPILIIMGFETHEVIHAVLLSQAIASVPAAFHHWRLGNIDLRPKGEDLKIIVSVILAGGLAVLVAGLLIAQLPPAVLKAYIGVIVVTMGIVLLRMRRSSFSWRRLTFFGVFSVVNKAVTGTGFGPVFTSGQLISGKSPRSSIGVSVAVIGPICLLAYLAHVLLMGHGDWTLAIVLIAGALPATLLGPLHTSKLKEVPARILVGVLTLALGIFMLINELALPHAIGFVRNPFFWAFVSMFALIGSTATLVSRNLGRYLQLNAAMVALFGIGRAMLVLPMCTQPRFDLWGWQYVIGGAFFLTGLGFMTALLRINPWPAPDEPVILVTTGHYGIVRNPMYLGEVLWSLGWAIMWQSIIGIVLVSLWWAGLLFLILLEEEDLERRLGKEYPDYKARVRGRLIPGLPV